MDKITSFPSIQQLLKNSLTKRNYNHTFKQKRYSYQNEGILFHITNIRTKEILFKVSEKLIPQFVCFTKKGNSSEYGQKKSKVILYANHKRNNTHL